MEWFKHTTTASNSKELRRLEKTYGFAGIGFYWKLYEKIQLNGGAFPMEEALSWARREFSSIKIRAVLCDSGLFDVDEFDMVHLAVNQTMEDEQNPSASESVADSDEQNPSTSENAAKNNGESAPTPARKEEKDKKDKREKGIGRVRQLLTLAATPEEQKFYQEMLDKFPNVCKLDDPLTYDEYLRIKKWNPDCDVGGLLQAMQNFRPLNKKYRSAYLTLKNWVKRE